MLPRSPCAPRTGRMWHLNLSDILFVAGYMKVPEVVLVVPVCLVLCLVLCVVSRCRRVVILESCRALWLTVLVAVLSLVRCLVIVPCVVWVLFIVGFLGSTALFRSAM